MCSTLLTPLAPVTTLKYANRTQIETNRSHPYRSSINRKAIINISIYTYIKITEYTLKLLEFLRSFPESNKNPVLQIVGARLLPFTPIPVRSESRSEALNLLLAVLTTHTPVPAYANTLLEL